jgi:hypothetical protein
VRSRLLETVATRVDRKLNPPLPELLGTFGDAQLVAAETLRLVRRACQRTELHRGAITRLP